MTCPDCNGWGGKETDECVYEPEHHYTPCEFWLPCYRCMTVGEVEVQRGPQDTDGEISDWPRPGSDWAIFARWEKDRES